MNLYSLMISIQLSLAVIANLSVTLSKYFNTVSTLQGILCIFVFLIAMVGVMMHLFYKVKVLNRIIEVNKTPRLRFIIFFLCLSICGVSVPLIVNFHKNVFTYAYFASGLIFYMASFIVLREMKKYFFSFRLVLADSFAILLLGVSSMVYPILRYSIANYYEMIGLLLMEVVVLLNAGIVYILVNIIRKEIKERKKKHKKKNIVSKFNTTNA